MTHEILSQSARYPHNICAGSPVSRQLEPSESYKVLAQDFMATPPENRREIGLGFPVYSKMLINPESQDADKTSIIMVFELAEETRGPVSLVDNSEGKHSIDVVPLGKSFLVVSQKALQEIHEASKTGEDTDITSLDGKISWLAEGEDLDIGSVPGNFASREMSEDVSESHATITITSESDVVVTNHSSKEISIVAPSTTIIDL